IGGCAIGLRCRADCGTLSLRRDRALRVGRGGSLGCIHGVGVRWHLCRGQRGGLCAARLALLVKAQSRALPEAHHHSPPQVGQREGGLAIPAVNRTQYRKQGRVLRYLKQRTIAKRPAQRREISPEDSNLTQKRFGHFISSFLFLISAGNNNYRCPCQLIHVEVAGYISPPRLL